MLKRLNIEEYLDRPIAYHRAFVPFAGVSGAILLSQAIYWSKRIPRESEWFYKTREEWQDETGLSRRAQESARQVLKDLGVLEEKLTGIPARLFFKINFEVLEAMLYQQGGTEDLASKQPQNARTNKLVHEEQPQFEADLAVPTNTETTNILLHKENSSSESLPIGESVSVPQDAKNFILPLTALEKWEMATELNVPLWVVQEADGNFWEYIEEPKNRKKYKTSYKTIRRWVQMGLEKGKYRNNNEVEVMLLQSQHPALIEQAKNLKELAKKERLVE